MLKKISLLLLLGAFLFASCEKEEKKTEDKSIYQKENLSGVYTSNFVMGKKVLRETQEVTIVDHQDGTIDFVVKDIEVDGAVSIKEMSLKNKQCYYNAEETIRTFNFTDNISVEIMGEIKRSNIEMSGRFENNQLYFDVFVEELGTTVSFNKVIENDDQGGEEDDDDDEEEVVETFDFSGEYVGSYSVAGQTINGVHIEVEDLGENKMDVTIEDVVLVAGFASIKGKKIENKGYVFNEETGQYDFVINDTLTLVTMGSEQTANCVITGTFSKEGILDFTVEASGYSVVFTGERE